MNKPVVLDFSDSDSARAFFDDAFLHPRRKYVVQPLDANVARRWLSDNATMLRFSWADGATPMQFGDLIHMDELYYRNRCGWVTDTSKFESCDNNGYLCDFPDDRQVEHLWPDNGGETCSQTGKRLCYPWQCPVAIEACVEDIKRKYPDLYRSDYKGEPLEDTAGDWMILEVRPRRALVANVIVLGCEKE